MKFHGSIQKYTFSREVEQFLAGSQVVFSAGHDRKFRPVIYFYPGRVREAELELFGEAVSFFLLTVTRHLMRDYFVENWVAVVDLEKRGFTNFPFKALQALMRVTSIVFAGRLHKMFLLNPTFMFYGFWKLFSNFMHADTVAKIQFLKKEHFKELLEVVAPAQLVDRYGGGLPAPQAPYPLRATFAPGELPLNDPRDIADATFLAAEPKDAKRSLLLNARMVTSMETLGAKESTDWDVG